MENEGLKTNSFEDRFTALGESEMQMFRFLLDKPAGVILTDETDKMLAQLLAQDDFVLLEPGDKVSIPDEVRAAYEEVRSDELILKWRKRNWMYKCIDAAKNLYGVMTWDALRALFGLRYPGAGMAEVMQLFDTTPAYYQWFTERDGKLVLNGFENDDYWKRLEQQIQSDVSFYVPTVEEVEDLFEQGSLIRRESHGKMREFIEENFGCDTNTAILKVHDLYECVNNHKRMNDVADEFAKEYPFPSDEVEYNFLELFMEMSRECRIRDNRGHDHYEMVAIMAGAKDKPQVKRAKVGRNDPCPCGSGKKYKNCCGRN